MMMLECITSLILEVWFGGYMHSDVNVFICTKCYFYVTLILFFSIFLNNFIKERSAEALCKRSYYIDNTRPCLNTNVSWVFCNHFLLTYQFENDESHCSLKILQVELAHSAEQRALNSQEATLTKTSLKQ